MKVKSIINTIIAYSITLNALFGYNSSSQSKDNDISRISKYEIKIPSSLEEHTMGFSSGIGSGITFKGITSDGNIEFYALSDRGPNYTISGSDSLSNAILFPRPDYSPFIGVVTIVPEKSATLTQIILLTVDGQKITGLPISTIKNLAKPSIPTDLNFKLLSADPKGFDTESLDIDSEGNFWIGDEYQPALIKAEVATGKIIEIFTPNNGLPKVLKHGPYNRGFEALAVAPNGKIYASMESILDFEGDTKTSANFIRIIELDPKTKQIRTFAYPFDKHTYNSPLAAKIGDMAAIDDTHFLLIEQGRTPHGMQNIIHLINIDSATDITNMSLPNGLDLEYGTIDELSNINFIKKSPIFNAPNYNWSHEKLEGIAIIDPKTIAITNDNDFGFSLSINGTNSEDVVGYSVDHNNQKLLRYGQKTEDKVDININPNASTDIWVIEFQKNLLDFMNSEQDQTLKLEH